MTTPFPLLRLPRLALIPVFEQMELIDVIVFSFLSNRTYNLSKYLCKKTSSRSINLRMENIRLRMRIALTNGSPLILYFYPDISRTAVVSYPYRYIQWRNTGLSTKQWIVRMFETTKCPYLRKVILVEKTDCDVFSVLNVVPKVTKLILSKLPFSNREEFQRFWLGNVERLCILDDDLSIFQFNVDDLLASNAVKLEMSKVSLSLRDLNRFFSCWLNKTSNHRLEHLSVKSLEEDINENVLLDGLDGIRFDKRRASEFPQSDTFPHFTTFDGGFDVRRIDGKLAAITFRSTFTKTFINFDARL